MQRNDTICVQHILDAAHKATSFVKDRTRKNLDTDDMLALSLVRLLEIIGEAANSVSVDFRDRYPHIPWRKMIGM